MTDAELIERLQAFDDQLDVIRQHSFQASDTLQRILMELLAMQKQKKEDQ
jgi:hypothetical protein